MKHFAYLLLVVSILQLSCISCRNTEKNAEPWPEVTRETKPWTRWWWMGSAVDYKNITSLMSLYSEAGIGGVEITPLYGVRGREEQYLEFLSPAWMDMLNTSISEAGRVGMAVDMNLGTGWPFGGPQVTPEWAASRLIMRTFTHSGSTPFQEKILPSATGNRLQGTVLESLMAYSEEGMVLDLTDLVEADGSLDWNPGSGSWELYAVFCSKTGQLVKRAAPGGQGFTLNHFSTPALDIYLARFREAFEGDPGVRSFFNDSYEVYGASWTPGLLDEFLTRRGYDLRDHLDTFSGEGDEQTIARLKSDYRETLSDLLLENFTRPWTAWSHSLGTLTRNQAHGSPGNLIDLYAAVDIPECEIFGHRNFQIPGMRINTDDTRNVEPNPMMLKLATSAAHITNKPLISNETFTWLGEHFKVALSQCKPEVEEAFLAGINHVFYHGTTYSPDDAPWPGWLFYASVHFGPTNSFWEHLPGLNDYITRCQSILQSGQPDNEILAYWPVYDIWNNPEGLEMQLSVHNIQEWLRYPGIDQMASAGYSYDFISDALLQQVKPEGGLLKSAGGKMTYRVLVIPSCELMPVQTLESILELVSQGSTVIFEGLPADVPGFHDLDRRRERFRRVLGALEFQDAGQGIREAVTGEGVVLLSTDLAKALKYAGIEGEEIGDYGLKYTRRSIQDGKYYYLVNHSSSPVDDMIPLNASASSVLLMDPQDGSYGAGYMEHAEGRTRVRVQLLPGESLFIRTRERGGFRTGGWEYRETSHPPVELRGPWELNFIAGGPVMPESRELEGLLPWTDLGDSVMLDFSGRASYSLTFQMSAISADRYYLDLGKVHESARVWLNGHDLGVVWSHPFRVPAGRFLQEGENKLVVEVANLMANRIRYMDRKGISWRNFHEINFVNIAYEPFDASDWETERSGLAGPVLLIPVDTH